MATPTFGPMQLRILQVLWDKPGSTAAQVTAVLREQEDVAHSTVQTLLRQLEEKGAVRHVQEGRTFHWFASVAREEVTASETRGFLDRLFRGSPSGLMAHLLREEQIPEEELDRIRRLLDEEER
jgi:BlaI family penicillinase repressor